LAIAVLIESHSAPDNMRSMFCENTGVSATGLQSPMIDHAHM